MTLKIDNFYRDDKLGRLKFLGRDEEGRLLFSQFLKVYGEWKQEKMTQHEDVIQNRIAKGAFRPSTPPA